MRTRDVGFVDRCVSQSSDPGGGESPYGRRSEQILFASVQCWSYSVNNQSALRSTFPPVSQVVSKRGVFDFPI